MYAFISYFSYTVGIGIIRAFQGYFLYFIYSSKFDCWRHIHNIRCLTEYSLSNVMHCNPLTSGLNIISLIYYITGIHKGSNPVSLQFKTLNLTTEPMYTLIIYME